MLENYLILHKNIVPENCLKVLEARKLLESGRVSNVTQAVKAVGISRSSYYKYRDFILEPSELDGGRKAVLSMMLLHEPGVLNSVLSVISSRGGSILTITQSLPIHSRASVTITIDISNIPVPIAEVVRELDRITGVEMPKLVALE